MRVLHSYCLNYNIGDYALGMGTKYLLRKYLSIDFFGETNLQGQTFSEYYINEVVNKRYDLLVIGGGGIIHGKHWPNGWFWLIKEELIKQIKIPFIVFSVGNNYFESEGNIPEKAIRHLQETEKHAKYFSVRNDGSNVRIADQLKFLPIEQPDPGFHLPNLTTESIIIQSPYIIVQLAGDKLEQRFYSKKLLENFISSMIKELTLLSKKYHILFCPHVFHDIELSLSIMKELKNCSIINFGEFAFDKSSDIIALYQKAEFVIAMRGHAQIIPIGYGVPVVSLFNHVKHRVLMEKLELSEYGLEISSPHFAQQFSMLCQRIEADLSAYHNLLKKIRIKLNKETDAAMKGLQNSLLLH